MTLRATKVKWASGNAWAPAIIERKEADGYKYYFYFSGHDIDSNRKAIGVAVSDSPTGPFKDLGHPIVAKSPVGRGQQIDVDVFRIRCRVNTTCIGEMAIWPVQNLMMICFQ